MAEALTMPKFGQTMEEGTIVSWKKKEGDSISKGDVVMEVETDKAVMDVESDLQGTLLKIVAPAGQTLKCGETMAWVGRPGEKIPA